MSIDMEAASDSSIFALLYPKTAEKQTVQALKCGGMEVAEREEYPSSWLARRVVSSVLTAAPSSLYNGKSSEGARRALLFSV